MGVGLQARIVTLVVSEGRKGLRDVAVFASAGDLVGGEERNRQLVAVRGRISGRVVVQLDNVCC